MSARIHILVGTMTGTAQLVAQELELAWDDGETVVATLLMDKLDAAVFEKPGVFLICTSTYGQGDVPDNAKALYEDLKAKRPDLSRVRYGVFGLGDRTYAETFNFGGKKFDELLSGLGAQRIGERVQHDASSGTLPEEVAAEWGQAWLELARENQGQTTILARGGDMEIPRQYNAAVDLVEGNLAAGRAGKTAYIDDAGQCSFGELAERVNRFGNHLLSLGLRMEDRILIAMHDSIDWPVAFLGAIKAGIVPIAVNTLLTPKDYEYMLSDSRAKALLVSPALAPQFEPFLAKLPFLKHILKPPFAELLAKASPALDPAPTTRDDPCFWLYSSGSTGMPKGTVHVHSSMRLTADLYAKGVLGLGDSDVVFSAAKLFFAYGLGNSLSFPLAAGATTILMAERPTPDAVFKRLSEKKPTLFFGVPTLYAAMLASPAFPGKDQLNLRQCISAGEALPPQISRTFKEKVGVEILDGIGSTEMLHIFLSNRPGDLRYGTTGKAVPGYELKLVDEQGNLVKQGELGELLIKGPTAANLYWNNREKSRSTFVGEWARSGDKYTQDADGFYAYGGRTDDMLKVSGIWVSPAEVEAALVSHEAVLEAAVVGHEDEQKLVKPKAFVVLKPGRQATVEDLQAYVKSKLAPYKYPRWIEFAAELPKTATGKIQRFKLRG